MGRGHAFRSALVAGGHFRGLVRNFRRNGALRFDGRFRRRHGSRSSRGPGLRRGCIALRCSRRNRGGRCILIRSFRPGIGILRRPGRIKGKTAGNFPDKDFRRRGGFRLLLLRRRRRDRRLCGSAGRLSGGRLSLRRGSLRLLLRSGGRRGSGYRRGLFLRPGRKHILRALLAKSGHTAADHGGGAYAFHGSAAAAQPFAEKDQFRIGKRPSVGVAAQGIEHIRPGSLLPCGVHARNAGAFLHAAALNGHFIPVSGLSGQRKGVVGAGEIVVGLGLLFRRAADGGGKRAQIHFCGRVQGNGKTLKFPGIDHEHVRHLHITEGVSAPVAGGPLHFLHKARRIHAVQGFEHARSEHIVQHAGASLQRVALHTAERAGIAVTEISLNERHTAVASPPFLVRGHIACRKPAGHVAHKGDGHHGILTILILCRRRILHLARNAVPPRHGGAALLHGLFHTGQKLRLRVGNNLARLRADGGRDFPALFLFLHRGLPVAGRGLFRSGLHGSYVFPGRARQALNGSLCLFDGECSVVRKKKPCAAARTEQKDKDGGQFTGRTGRLGHGRKLRLARNFRAGWHKFTLSFF